MNSSASKGSLNQITAHTATVPLFQIHCDDEKFTLATSSDQVACLQPATEPPPDMRKSFAPPAHALSLRNCLIKNIPIQQKHTANSGITGNTCNQVFSLLSDRQRLFLSPSKHAEGPGKPKPIPRLETEGIMQSFLGGLIHN